MLVKIYKPSLFLLNIRSVSLLFALAALLLTSCKDDEKITPDDPKTEDSGILPARGQAYRYKHSDSEGSESNSVLKVTNVKDSSGIAVLNIEEVFGEGNDSYKVYQRGYTHGGSTTHEISDASGVHSLVAYVGVFADIEEVTLTGFPLGRSFENKTAVGSKVTFSSSPVKLHMKLAIPVEGQGSIPAQIDATVKYLDGQLIKEETIITPAGTFKCSKWEYGYELITKLTGEGIPAEDSKVVYTVHLWTAPGVGVVKSIEASGSDVSNTELQKIEKQ